MDPLGTRALGRSGLQVTQLGFGGAPLGDFYARLPEDQAISTVEAACSSSLRLFDTSPLYGHGLSEHRFGHVLRQKPRDSFVLSTKVGRWLRPRPETEIDRGWFKGGLNFEAVVDYSYDGAMRSFDQSLHRLGLNSIDVILIHDVDVWSHGKDAYEQHFRTAMNGAYRAVDELRRVGTVKAIGIGVNEIEPCLRFAAEGDFDCFLLAGRYTLLEHAALDELLPTCVRKGIGIVVGGPYNSGILATGAVPGAKYNYFPAPPEVLDRVSRIESVCRRHAVPIAAAALQFPLGHPAVSTTIPGAVAPQEIARNKQLMTTPIPADLWAELKHEGLMPAEAPVPT
ncbi:MAG: aldo/keto reductase [Methylobacteriaceae bacterium]|nr:aldo/keto reductase [Methylobacteriaceae bacterium]